jgi:peroxiredoxin
MAQDSTRAAMPAVGDAAPDFVLPAATREGAAGSFRLSDFRGKTVVLAFFFKARTKG